MRYNDANYTFRKAAKDGVPPSEPLLLFHFPNKPNNYGQNLRCRVAFRDFFIQSNNWTGQTAGQITVSNTNPDRKAYAPIAS